MPSQAFVLLMLWLAFLVGHAYGQSQPDQQKLDRDLYYAVLNGKKASVQRLLKEGANPDGSSGSGQSPLRQAVRQRDPAFMRMLIEAGADVNAAAPRKRRSILEEAAEHRPLYGRFDDRVACLLAEGARPTPEAMRSACRLENFAAVEALLMAGVPADAGLAEAARAGNAGLVEKLIQEGAGVDGRGDPPLGAAAREGHEPIVALLLSAGADPNAADQRGRTPLHHTADSDPVSIQAGALALAITDRLLGAGARPDLADESGVTAIRLSAIMGRTDLYERLLKHCGGVEPPPSNLDDRPEFSTERLLEQVAQGGEASRVAQRLLVKRGEIILPALLKHLEVNGLNGGFADLLEAMGPRANGAKPYLESLLDDEELVFGALLTLNRMDPQNIKRLPEAARERAAAALDRGIRKHPKDVYGPFLMSMLVGLGEEAAPHLLEFLSEGKPGLRAGAAEDLQRARFHSQEIEEKLIDLLLRDPVPGVRKEAARALQNKSFQSDATRDALLGVLATARIENNAADFGKVSTEVWRQRALNSLALNDLLSEAARALSCRGPKAVAEIRESFSGADIKTQANYAKVYDYLGNNPETFQPFVRLIDDPNEAVRLCALEQIAKLAANHSSEAEDLLLRRYADGDQRIRHDAARSIATIATGRRAIRFLPHLLTLADDEDSDLRIRMNAMASAVRIDPVAAQQSAQAAALAPLLMDQVERGEGDSPIIALNLLGDLGVAAASVTDRLQAFIDKPVTAEQAGDATAMTLRRVARGTLVQITESVTE